MNDTDTPSTVEKVGDRIEQVCHDIDELLATLRDQARRLREIADDEPG